MKLLVREVPDINRAIIHLFTRWALPRVQLQIDSLPAVVVQHAQHRIMQIAEAPRGGLGVVLASTLIVVGTYAGWTSFHSMIWTPTQLWHRVALLAIAALYVGLIGWGVGAAWIRVKLMRVLLHLRHRLVAGDSFKEPARYAGRIAPTFAVKIPAAIEGAGEPQEDFLRQPLLLRAKQPRLVLHSAADVNRLLIHLLTHWKLPRVRIDVDGVATLDVQRAQHHIARLSEACNCVLGACLAAATILGGVFFVEWKSAHNWDWWVPESWGPLGLVPVTALCAAAIGVAIEMVWTRVRMMRVARGVRHRLGA
jgi:hypothetical protein